MADDEAKRPQTTLTAIEARLKALAAADDCTSWDKLAAARGGFRQEQVDLRNEAARIGAQFGPRLTNT